MEMLLGHFSIKILLSQYYVINAAETKNVSWYTKAIEKYLKRNYSVFTVFWGTFSKDLLGYAEAMVKTDTFGQNLANVFDQLFSKNSVRAKNVHVIGHSLGAHLDSYLGMFLKN